MLIETQDVDASLLAMDMLPWLDAPLGDMFSFYEQADAGGQQQQGQSQAQQHQQQNQSMLDAPSTAGANDAPSLERDGSGRSAR